MKAPLVCLLSLLSGGIAASAASSDVLRADSFAHFVESFNRNDQELYPDTIPNAVAGDWMRKNVPLFECPDKDIEEIYYFRWWTYRKHIKHTPDGFVITEFLPDVPWAGKDNTISCAAGHHFREGRWIADPQYLDDYARFWFRKGGNPRAYSFWAADSIVSFAQVTGDFQLAVDLLPDLVRNYEAWEADHRDTNGLFWQVDDRDGMEMSISGDLQKNHQGYRPTINSYLYGDARAIAEIARHAGKDDLARRFEQKAADIKRLTLARLWNPDAQFFEVIPRGEGHTWSGVRELIGFTPWYFDLPDAAQSIGWKQLMDPQGFSVPFGPTTAEQRDPRYAISYEGHECQWNGPSWPYSTSVTLTAMANLLNDCSQNVVTREDYLNELKTYTRSQHRTLDDGRVVPWIDENLNPTNGDWISRTRLKSWKNGTWDAGKGGVERGKDYNHSTYCDLIISGLVGLRPRADQTVEVNPLAPDSWDYFCLDRVHYHGHWFTILWDKSGTRYGRGKGLQVFADGQKIAAADQITKIRGELPESGAASAKSAEPVETTAGWKKYAGNPVMGGKYGTCFDISVLKEGDTYRMWLSWRPKKSVALVESKDGIHWTEPPQVVLGPRKETGWEDDINRPVVIKRDDGYQMWYTGQANGHSWIGYATSPDGVHWKRMSDRPVLSPDQPWEKVAVMCPHAIWDEPTKTYRLWYSGGEQYEPNALGYATSPDGLHWTKNADNPIFKPDPSSEWDQARVTAAQVVKAGDWYVMFYIGFRDIDHAQIGLARSRDGITNWQRHPANPIIRPGLNKWDHDACYKPFAIFDGRKWLLWYNGRHGSLEQIGVVFHEGKDLGFD